MTDFLPASAYLARRQHFQAIDTGVLFAFLRNFEHFS